MGTVHVLEAVRQAARPMAVVNVTTDKVYLNQRWVWSYRENDVLGGRDPYSSSKACSELVTQVLRRVLLCARQAFPARRGRGVSTRRQRDRRRRLDAAPAGACRGGGGAGSESGGVAQSGRHPAVAARARLPDRLPHAGRASGDHAGTGVRRLEFRPVGRRRLHGGASGRRHRAPLERRAGWIRAAGERPPEEHELRLDCSKAARVLGWRCTLDTPTALDWVADWHLQLQQGRSAREVSMAQIEAYLRLVA